MTSKEMLARVQELVTYKDVLLAATRDLSQACSILCDASRAKGTDPPAEAVLLMVMARSTLAEELQRSATVES